MIAELVVAAALAAGPGASVTLDGVKIHLREGTTQVVTVNHTDGHHARVTFWKLAGSGWRARFGAEDGRIGYGGLVRGTRREQGTGTTPLGTYALPWAFGTGAADERWRLRYRHVEPGDFWVQDNASPHYNRYRNQAEGGFRWWLPASDPDASERLTDFGRQYRISVVTDFNVAQVRHRGAGIFLHVNGAGATAGCVSAPGVFMDKLMRALDPGRVPVIAVGR
ncbi:L,D-transpeptidase family protein [Nocardioides halotolerans]|uniref:L,D-transpeptidase family protein n=1 Tax=Nocardioides halotolerans TaxID=433660 RepID=UPI0004233AF1|nr:L,D-transpeptidase family protein [Nocardioides halotolerans]